MHILYTILDLIYNVRKAALLIAVETSKYEKYQHYNDCRSCYGLTYVSKEGVGHLEYFMGRYSVSKVNLDSPLHSSVEGQFYTNSRYQSLDNVNIVFYCKNTILHETWPTV